MRKVLALSMVICLTCMLAAGSSVRGVAYAAEQSQNDAYEPYAPEQLDNLLAPIALYPDPLLAQVLIASTFPDQIQDASGWVRRYGANNYGVDDQSWDVSVKAVAHYPTVLSMMNDQLDWTTALGQAYVNQSTDVMASVQHLRQLARTEGNLISTPQQQVIVDGGYIEIVPAEPQYIFVPAYDPAVIYSRRVYTGSGFGGFFSFGSGFAIGAWLNYDLDWGSRRVVYDGWRVGGWRERSRPYVHVTNVYVNNRYENNVVVNRTVVNRQVNYGNVNRFNSVHRDVRFDNRARFQGRPGDRPNDRPNNDANRNERGVQPSQPSRSNEGFNRGRDQNQVPAPQQSPQVPRQNDSSYRGQQNRGGQNQAPPTMTQPQQSRSNEGFNRGRDQNQVPAPQQSPQVPRQNGYNDRSQQNRGGQNQTPPAVVQPSQPSRSNGDLSRGRGPNQAPSPAPQQSPQVPRQNQAPPARVDRPAPQPTPPAQAQRPQQEKQPQGHNDQGNKDGKDNKDRGQH
jgi:hypothetical protein